MKLRFLLCLTFCVVLMVALFGGVKRQTYTDLSKEKNYLEELQVDELSEKNAIAQCRKMSNGLPESPIILRVLVTGDIEHLFGVSQQKVSVQEVYAGSGLKVGQEINLSSINWYLCLSGDPNSIERGFVNVMRKGKEYLVFASKQIKVLNETTPVYELYDKFFIAPVFCYENQSNVIAATVGEGTYVPYAKVRNNEFFAENEAALDAMEKLKSKMISAYPINKNSSQ